MRFSKNKLIASLLALALWSFLFTGPAEARGKYERGRTLYMRRCGPCFSMGWRWAPTESQKSKKRWPIMKMARRWGPAQVCTWMRKPRRQLKGKGCYPGRIPFEERVAILYYLTRRLEGPIEKPKLRRIMPKRAKNLRLRRKAPARRRKAIKRHKNFKELRRIRRGRGRYRRKKWSGQLTAPRSGGKKGRMVRRRYFRNRKRRSSGGRRSSSRERKKEGEASGGGSDTEAKRSGRESR